MFVPSTSRVASVLAGLAAFCVVQPAAAQSSTLGQETAYDLGYAHRASQSCPNTELMVQPDAAAQANSEFAKGVAMFEHYLKMQSIDGACRAALSLYNSKTGKVAKVLRTK